MLIIPVVIKDKKYYYYNYSYMQDENGILMPSRIEMSEVKE